MIAEEYDDTIQDYDDATRDVSGSSYNNFDTNLSRWYEVIEESPVFDNFVSHLEQSVDFDAWYKEREETVGGMAGSGQLIWPAGALNRLAMQLALLRAVYSKRIPFMQFYQGFIGGSGRIDDIVYKFTLQIFDPVARDLRKHALRNFETRSASIDAVEAIPASDRLVALDHNSESAAEIQENLERLEEQVRGSNDINEELREQRTAEISAGRRLLQATRVRIDALIAVLYRSLKSLSKQFADKAIGLMAASLIALLGRWTGLW